MGVAVAQERCSQKPLSTADGWDLPSCLKNEIKRECQRLWQVIEMIMEVEAEQR
ncbi:hypothetical protein [Mesorhizobium sp. M0254]|uniref:hypothetical protein n=1 Tax=Mesorhizobium sp. M0254 TaxID=2956927 RepID=UPI003337FF1A